MKKLFENWNKFLNEAWDPHGNWKSRYSDGRSKGSDAEPETDEERAHRRAKEAREDERRREAGLPPIKSKYFEESENEYEPGRAVTDIDTGEDYMSPEEIRDEEVQDLADKFNVEAFVEIASDGKPSIIVKHQDGKVSMYNDTEEMYKELADETGQDIHGSHDWYGDESPYDAGY